MIPKERTLTETQMNAMTNPPVGIVYYNTDRGKFVVYDGANWMEVIGNHVLFYENFEDGSMPSSITAADDTDNAFKVGTAEKHQGSFGLYVSNDGGTSANYSAGNICHIYFDVAIPPDAVSLSLSFHWKGVAEPSYDFGEIYLDETASYTPSGGTSVTTSSTLYQIGKTEYNDQSSWVEDVINIDNSVAGKNIRFIMSFESDAGSWSGSNEYPPSFCLDDIYVKVVK
jgi:hypothetical protein